MQQAPRLVGERERLDALRRYHLLDTPADPALDDLTALASHICGTPISTISLLDEHRQWFKSRVGMSMTETARDISFCSHAILGADLLVVPDAALDARFVDNPLVTGEPRIRFYAGTPLVTPDGHALGALCVIDHVPRELNPAQLEALRVLGRQVIAQVELRRQTQEVLDSEARLRIVTENAKVGLVIVDRDRRYVYANSTYAEILGLSAPVTIGARVADVLPAVVYEQIRPRLDRAFAGERVAYELHTPGETGDRYSAVRYEPTWADGSVDLVVVVITDVTDRRLAESAEQLSHERFQMVARATNDVVWDWNIATDTLWRNEIYQTLFGHVPDRGADQSLHQAPNQALHPATTRPGSWEHLIHPDDRRRVLYGIHEVIDRGGTNWADEYRFRRADGTYADVFDRGFVIRDTDGRAVRMVGAMQDVTDRRQAEIASVRFAAIVESSEDAIIGKDLNGIITSWNRGAEAVFGYLSAEVIGAPIMTIIPVDRQEEETHILSKIRRGESVKHFETVRVRKDGRRIDVSVAASPIRDSTGRIIGASKVARDISEQRAAEAARRASEGRYRTLFDYAPDGILIADRDGRYLDANTRMCEMLGYACADLIGLQSADIVAVDEHPQIAIALDALNARADHIREWKMRRKDGSTFPAEVIATQMPEGTIMAMVRDVTKQNQATEALRTAEERMRFALESASVGIWDMNYRTGVLGWSELLEVQHGLVPGTFAGTFDAFVSCIHPDDRKALLEHIDKATIKGEDFRTQYRTLWPDGTVRWLEGTGRVHLGEHGAPLRGVGVSMDVTERHSLEAQYQQAQKMEAIGRLAGGVAHDFNNLLTAILGYCELLQTDLGPGDPRQADVGEIHKAGVSAAALTKQLLAFSRKQIIEPVELEVNVVIQDMRAMLARLIGEDVDVALVLTNEPMRVRADRGQIEQIVLNLAVNARDAMPGGGRLTIETRPVDFDEAYARSHLSAKPGPYVALIVTDTGTGMTPDTQARLFEPFFTTKETGKGTGLGLATVHGIISRSGGTVEVYSELGKGAAFKVYFPRLDADTVAAEPVRRPSAPAVPRTILVVDDAEGLRELARKQLQRHGHTVLVAGSADDAERQFLGHPGIELLLTDVVMPGASGPELTRRLIDRHPGLKVIYMSGYTEDAIIHHGVLKPGIAFMHKPFSAGSLERKIQEVCGSEKA